MDFKQLNIRSQFRIWCFPYAVRQNGVPMVSHWWHGTTRRVNKTTKDIFFKLLPLSWGYFILSTMYTILEPACLCCSYLLLFQVCKTSASLKFNSLACASSRSNRNLTTGGKLEPSLYLMKTVWNRRSTNFWRAPCKCQVYMCYSV